MTDKELCERFWKAKRGTLYYKAFRDEIFNRCDFAVSVLSLENDPLPISNSDVRSALNNYHSKAEAREFIRILLKMHGKIRKALCRCKLRLGEEFSSAPMDSHR